LFERFTELARRSVFFARYEASVFGTNEITSEQLLLGILQEDKTLAMRLGASVPEKIREHIEKLAPGEGQRVSTSVDLPLSQESQGAIMLAVEEAAALHHKLIEPSHLVLGLLRVEDCLAARLLRGHGMEYESYREMVVREASFAASLQPKIEKLQYWVETTAAQLRDYQDSDGDQRVKSKPWTRKVALGDLIDWAMTHQQWFARALAESRLVTGGYPVEGAEAVRHYAEYSWSETVELWISLNQLLIHVLMQVPEGKLEVPCRIGAAEPVPFAKLIDAYVEHCEEVVAQILDAGAG
jgi:hypothetical protein